MSNKIKELPLNDRFSQYYEQMPTFITDDVKNQRLERIKRVKRCNHLFVLLEKGEYVSEFNSSDCEYVQNTVECVHCGLTNKFMCFEDKGMMVSGTGVECTRETLDSKLFREIFASSYFRDGKSFKEGDIKLISNEPLYTDHVGLLYRLAILISSNINQDATLEEIFQIMIVLDKLETKDERIRLKNIEDTKNLITRYFDLKRKQTLRKIRKK